MKILITGGNGYIAKSINKNLCHLYDITNITKKDFDLENKDQTHEWFNNKSFDVVIHTANKGGSRLKNEDENTLKSNVNMFNNLLNNKSKFNKLISLGSGAEIFQQNTFYGKSKKIINDLIQKENNFYNTRIFGIFDENEPHTRFIKSNILRYLNKQPIEIHSNKIMDFIYMEDFVDIVNYYINYNNLPKEINCCYEQKYTLKNIADMINKLDSYKVNINIENKNILEFYCGESDLPINTIGLSKGIENTFRKIKDKII